MNFKQIDILTIEQTLEEYNKAIETQSENNISYYWCCSCTRGGYRCGYAIYGWGYAGSCYSHGQNECVDVCGNDKGGYCCEK